MKTTKALFGILAITAALTINGLAQVQIYQLTTPISGSMTMSAKDWTGPSGSSAVVDLNFNSLSETLYLDPSAGTLRQVGTIFYTPSASQVQWEETQAIAQPYPNPPSNITGTVTVNLVSGSGNTLSFDTGPQILAYAAPSTFTVNGTFWTSGLPVSASYSLVAGGQTNTGSLSYALTNVYSYEYTFKTILTADAPSSIQLSGLGNVNPQGLLVGPGTMTEVTSASGFQIELGISSEVEFPIPGIGELFAWSSPSVTATNLSVGAPSITGQPQSLAVQAYNAASFSVTNSGAAPISYQWSLNGTSILGATNSSLTISNVMQTNLGTYVVVVANSFGTNTSSNAVLSMYPFLASPFSGVVTDWGMDSKLSVQAWGTGPLNYQWFDNGAAVLNATNPTLEFTSIQFTNAGLYSVVVSNALGSVTNIPEQVVVNPAGVSLGLYPGVTLSGVIGYNYIIQRTADLSNTNAWVTVDSLTLTQPIQLWVDTNVNTALPENPHQFYQVLPGQ